MKCITIFLLVIVVLFLFSPGITENRVSIDVAKSGIVIMPYDTLYVGGEYEITFSIENDQVYGGMTIGTKFGSLDGVTWEYIEKPNGFGSPYAFLTVTESRLDPAAGTGSFDMTGLLISEYDVDMTGYDTVGVGGVALNNGLSPGLSEHMYSYHFKLTGPWDPDNIHTFYVDTSLWPPTGACAFCYVLLTGEANMFTLDCQNTWPVKLLCGNPNGDDDVNVGDCVFMINYIFHDGPAPVPWQLGDANCDGVLDVGDIVFLIAASFRYGPQPECPDYEMSPPNGSPGDGPAKDYLPDNILCDTLFFQNQ